MVNGEQKTQVKKDLYRTTFSRKIEYKITDFISTTFLLGMVDAIAERMKRQQLQIEVQFSLDNGASIKVNGKTKIKNFLKDSQKYKRNISSVEIGSGIVYAENGSDTHFSLDFYLHRAKNFQDINIRAYAVANNRENSQQVIDWGNGTLRDFQNISLLEQEPQNGELVIKLDDGSVTEWQASDNVQKVEVVNVVKTSPSKWGDKQNVIAVAAILVAILIAVIGWIFFSQVGRP